MNTKAPTPKTDRFVEVQIAVCSTWKGRFYLAIEELREIERRKPAVDALVAALRDVVRAAQPIASPLGAPMTEHVDKFTPEIEAARALLADLVKP